MIIRKAEVSARGSRYSGVVQLELVQRPEGWTYRVDGMTTGVFELTWHAATPEKATRKLRDVYSEAHWELKIIE
ncbi:MAG: hypothetical protein QNJ04_07950 [Desulfobacterales bacterium]|nr:hypothetical protein [Desulfobacterales bacterium]